MLDQTTLSVKLVIKFEGLAFIHGSELCLAVADGVSSQITISLPNGIYIR